MLYRLQECRRFCENDQEFLFLIPTSLIVRLDPLASRLVDLLQESGPQSISSIQRSVNGSSTQQAVSKALEELRSFGAVVPANQPTPPPASGASPVTFPLRTLVLNVTNTCNLSCGYCYEYGEDRLHSSPTRLMSPDVARRAVDFLLDNSGDSEKVNLTFFGGEPLTNFKLIQETIGYARRKARECGKRVDFSLTTNATLLTTEIIDYLADQRIGITVSIDGPREMNDKLRVFQSGRGSYDVIAPRITELLQRHTLRPVGARVTLTAGVHQVQAIFDHLMDLGFHEVGFAPVTTSIGRDYALFGEALNDVLKEFEMLAERFVEAALRDTYLGFSNLSDTLWELHHGFSKDYPCGAGLGLLGVSPTGDLALCHRFAESPKHQLGTLESGLDSERRGAFLQSAHLSRKTDCHACWVRHLCSGGCYHEASVRYGDTFHPNLHYCDWIRDWTEIGLRAYVRILEGNPAFIERFEGRKDA